jgi:hypothetical protein
MPFKQYPLVKTFGRSGLQGSLVLRYPQSGGEKLLEIFFIIGYIFCTTCSTRGALGGSHLIGETQQHNIAAFVDGSAYQNKKEGPFLSSGYIQPM